MRSFFTDNVNSILAAISVHLLIVLVFFWFKLGQMDEIKKDQVLVEFNEVVQPPPEEQKPAENEQSSDVAGQEMTASERQALHTMASNEASKLDPKISTSEYEKQVLQELGISSLKSPGAEMEKEAAQKEADENAIARQENEKKDAVRDLDRPNVIRKDNTTVSYFLEGRWHSYIYIPTYKCQGGGTVVLDIVINPNGRVLSAIIQENKSTADPCLREEAYRSAVSAQFNADPKASAKQLGSITYVFLAQ
ncbi:MAG TPA: hypothetical protein VK179_11150 [Bacteroidales bacterium]|nr:hypothetical protein [Bacteroidales bacterium]